ncbi:uncharacterized protein FOMMEDRAFT_24379 [Fomitiporia mediterranea MF3/22]|uniref:Uncharacterized protein n=1 Tax=Fomitiporia mediterranea (strain MF3/22) TaxID=694068 RepID=R7SFN3_FOMME|nr:uncharacterized protein FOMMEDRAFT_24379 [Fomitiporia mediterranea MF3/22]EJC97536.1 hypothetical protein FOMMEDRAFT_24379 [Fomitiporia mediterranea MF3/22]
MSYYAQPFQPLGQPISTVNSPNYGWSFSSAPPLQVTNAPPLGPKVQYVVGSPQGNLRRTQSIHGPFPAVYPGENYERRNRHRKSHAHYSNQPARNRSSYGPRSGYNPPAPAISFPEPEYYLPYAYGPPPPYPGGPTYGISADEISLQPEHCTFLMDAVKEMDLCSRIFSTWVQQLNSADVGRKDKVEANIVSMITVLADDAVKMLTASRNILSSYKALARLMDRRLSTLASSAQGGDLFAPQVQDDFQTLSLDVHVHSVEISACVEKMQEGLHGLHDAVLRTHEKYSFRKKFWGWMCRVFRFIAQGLFLSGAATALAHPLGLVGTAAIHVGSGLATVVASVCEKIKEAYDDEEKGINEVMKLLQGKIPKSMRVAQTALEKFQAAHIVFRQHQRVAQGRASGYIAPTEAARARSGWKKAAELLEWKDKTTLQLNIDSMSW